MADAPTKKKPKSELTAALEAERRRVSAIIADTYRELLDLIQAYFNLSNTERKKLHERLWSFCFTLRQPVATDLSCNKTPFFLRWIDDRDSWIIPQSPRYATPDQCEATYRVLLASLLQAHDIVGLTTRAVTLAQDVLEGAFQPGSLTCIRTRESISRTDIKLALGYSTSSVGAFEIPTSYVRELDKGGYHRHDNVGWMKPLHIVYRLRSFLRADLAELGVPRTAVDNMLAKIAVKSYATDKQTIPPYYSNRDIRWATWTSEGEAREAVAVKRGEVALIVEGEGPSTSADEEYIEAEDLPDTDEPTEVKGIQYASHFDCALVELELIAQLYEFEGAPALNEDVAVEVARYRGHELLLNRPCLITGEVLRFTDFAENARNQRGGKSAFHVGHMVPLTRTGKHERANIAWLSEIGNRIQGNSNLEEIEVTLLKAVAYHIRRDIRLNKPHEELRARRELLETLSAELQAHMNA